MTWHRWIQIATAVYLGVVLAAATLWFVVQTSQVLGLFFIGFVIAYILDPTLDWLEARGWARVQAVVVVSVAIVAIIGLLATWLVPNLVVQAQQLAKHWPDYSNAIASAYDNAEQQARMYVEQRFPEYDIAPYMDVKVEQARQWLETRIAGFLDYVINQLVRSVSLIGVLVLIAIITFYFMMVIDPMRQTISGLVPRAARDDVDGIGEQVEAMLGGYVRGKVTVMLTVAALSTLSMFVIGAFFGTNYALVLGLVAGIAHLVPWVGPVISGGLGALLSYVSAAHNPFIAAGSAAVALIGWDQFCDQVVAPRVIGRSIGLHPLLVIFSILAGYQLLGVTGMVLGAPAAATIKIILARWLPLKQPKPDAGRRQPLAVDVAAAIKIGYRSLSNLAQRVEGAVGVGEEHPEPAETDDDDRQSDTQSKEGHGREVPTDDVD